MKIRETLQSALKELQSTSSRRRIAFWQVAQRLRNAPNAKSKIDHVWHMEYMGYHPGLQLEDLEWLLSDGLTKSDDDCRLAVEASLKLYRDANRPAGMLDAIASATSSHPVAAERYREMTEVRPLSPDDEESNQKLRELEEENQKALNERDQSWIDFIGELRNDPARISALRTASTTFNNDLHGLWQLLSGADSRSRYAIDNVAPIKRVAGAEVAEAAQTGLIARWRIVAPLLKSKQSSEERNTVRHADLMGLVGVTLEASNTAGWADRLLSEDAALAAGYATLEINGFPRWMAELATAKPTEVRSVLMAEILAEMALPVSVHRDTLNKVLYAGDEIASILAPGLFDELEKGSVPQDALSSVLEIVVRGLAAEQRVRFVKFGIEKFENGLDAVIAVPYLAAAFSFDPGPATAVLRERIERIDGGTQSTLLDRFLMASFGGSVSGPTFRVPDLPSETLEELLRLEFKTRSHRQTRERPEGVVYKIDDRDEADYARNALFNRLLKTPETYHSIIRLQADPNCTISTDRMRELAEERAIQDSERAPWAPSDAFAFETEHEVAPRSAKDLRATLVSRIEDMQHDLLHGDFAQGETLKMLPDESAVQNWVADRLRLKQGIAYSVEREPQVVDKKEPDIRIRAKGTDASVAIEVKITKSWSLKELDDALEAQLCGRYLRASDGRYGVLLLVHQNARPKGWEGTTAGQILTFTDVVARLSARAAEISCIRHDSPQPLVCVLDVSSVDAKK